GRDWIRRQEGRDRGGPPAQAWVDRERAALYSRGRQELLCARTGGVARVLIIDGLDRVSGACGDRVATGRGIIDTEYRHDEFVARAGRRGRGDASGRGAARRGIGLIGCDQSRVLERDRFDLGRTVVSR